AGAWRHPPPPEPDGGIETPHFGSVPSGAFILAFPVTPRNPDGMAPAHLARIEWRGFFSGGARGDGPARPCWQTRRGWPGGWLRDRPRRARGDVRRPEHGGSVRPGRRCPRHHVVRRAPVAG